MVYVISMFNINYHPFAQTFLKATVTISLSVTPFVHDVILWINVMTKHLKDTHDDINKLPIVHSAAHKGFKILQKYYQHSDETLFYHIAMCASCSGGLLSFQHSPLFCSPSPMLPKVVLHACPLAFYMD